MANVLRVVDSLGLGGAQMVLKSYFEAQKENTSILLFSLRKRAVNIEIDHPNVIIFQSESRFSLAPIFRMKSLIKERKITILHCDLFRSQVFGYLLKKIFFQDLILIFHEHGEIFQNHWLYNQFLKHTQNSVNRFIAVSSSTKQALNKEANINQQKITVIHNPVGIQFSEYGNDSGLREYRPHSKDRLVIGFSGRLSKEKGCDVLLRALAKAKFSYQLLIAGEGSEKTHLVQLSKILGITDQITFLGYVKGMKQFYQSIDILVIPSRAESFGLVAIEAQTMYIPVIASAVGGLKDIIVDRQNGLLFQSSDENALLKQIELLKQDQSIKRDIIRNGVTSAKSFNIETYVAQQNSVYDSL